jgi:hypothetical protein
MTKKLIIKKTNTINNEYNTEIDALKKWTIKTIIICIDDNECIIVFNYIPNHE